MVGEELHTVGVGIDFAPVLDVNDNPTNPVIALSVALSERHQNSSRNQRFPLSLGCTPPG
jgi:hypothetical protein